MNNRHPWPLKKSKSWGPFWRYQLNSTAIEPIQPIHRKNGPNGLNWLCCVTGSSKTAPTILIFSIAMGADYSFQLISIVHCVPQFFMHNKSILGGVVKLKWGLKLCCINFQQVKKPLRSLKITRTKINH